MHSLKYKNKLSFEFVFVKAMIVVIFYRKVSTIAKQFSEAATNMTR